ncbi:hypothetical protein KTO58_10230 [Chitinophaga pendula]|uniref:hypothetical protein n=1 Tax=Chitinophaga TaxID=79328 RepID=UPI000BAFF845|nr:MULTISPECIES: hypothetical protein [Chitinophaga]ASZ12832.1 hypothetical protein CK934_18660 [Chitinophaga sp. MD30]UCJ09540.1 hypothetical protein KTO58_10230 [Chitinophaga pendula]
MEYKEIRQLLKRYWEAETSLEEEAVLQAFFAAHAGEELPEDLREAAPLFAYFGLEHELALELPEADISWPDFHERPPMQVIQGGAGKTIRPWQHWMKYAAVLLMVAGIGYGVQRAHIKQVESATPLAQRDTYDDPEKAFAEAQKALALVAKNLNKGTRQMEKLTYFNEATDRIKETN